jgi:non-lysosomal glucosylceramidase
MTMRWLLMITAVAAVIGGLPAMTSQASAAASSRDFFPVPDAALVRSLGDISPGTCAPPPAWQACQGDNSVEGPNGFGSILGNYPMSVPGLGIPVGGVGAGSFMINQAGTFGPWNFGGAQGSNWETRVLPQAAFHVREQLDTGAPTVRTLATDGPTNVGTSGPVSARSWGSPLPAWNALKPGEGSYAALYPFGWMSYTPFKTDVSMRFFSPIVAGEDRRTSLPLVYFDVRIANHTSSNANMSVMFTMPNAPDHVAGTKSDPSSPDGPASVRTGYHNTYQNANGVQAVTMSADDPSNTPDAQDSEWTIAAKPAPGQKVSYTTSWNAGGDGSDVYAPFTDSGALPNEPLDNSGTAGAITVSAKLQPGQVATIPFALAWDFPQVGFDNNQTVWMRRYTNFYGAKETATNDYVAGSYPLHQSFNIARDGLVGHDTSLSAVHTWWQPIASDTTYPQVLRTASLNQLSQLVFSNSFWEGGLVSNTVTPTGFSSTAVGNHLDASRPGSHLFGIMDGGGGGVANEAWTDNIETHGYVGYFKLFPNLMKDQLAAEADASALAPNQNTPIGLYNTGGDPFILFDTGTNPAIQDGSAAPSPGQTQWLDNPSDVIFEFYAYSKINGDVTFLRSTYPAIMRNLSYLQKTIPPGSYLPSDAPLFANIFDTVPQGGVGVYDSELYLLSLEVGVAAGTEVGADPIYVAGLQADLTNAKAEFELTLWDPVQNYYRFNAAGPAGDAAFADTFFAQHLAEQVGLPDLVNQTDHRAELTTTYPQFLRHDAAGDPTGAPMLEEPGGLEAPDGYYPPEVSFVIPGTNYMMAADYYQTGKRYYRPDLEADAVQLASAVATQVWLNDDNGFQFDSPFGYSDTDPTVYAYPAYSMALSIFDLMDAIKPIKTATLTSG